MQEFNNVKEAFKTHRSKYTKYKILYDSLWEYAFHSNCPDNLKSKLQDILLTSDCAQVVDLESNGIVQNSQVLVDLGNIYTPELTYNESLKLKKALESFLQNKHKGICQQFFKMTGKHVNVDMITEDFGEFSLNSEDGALLELRKKLEEQLRKYVDNLLKEKEILEQIVKLRIEKLPKASNDKIKECQFKSRVTELQSKIVKEKTRIDIFMETNNSLLAYEELMRDIKEQQEECQRDISYFKKLKKQYQHIACKQYDDLLKSFIQYKSSSAKKREMYESLHSLV